MNYSNSDITLYRQAIDSLKAATKQLAKGVSFLLVNNNLMHH